MSNEQENNSCSTGTTSCCGDKSSGADTSGCSDISGCCGTSGGNRSFLKTLIFFVVIIAALLVASKGMLKVDASNTGNCSTDSASATAPDNTLYFMLFECTGEMTGVVNSVAKKMTSQGNKVLVKEYNKGDKGFDDLIGKYSLKSFPSVVVTKDKCRPGVISGGNAITESNLLLTSVKALSAPASCAPSSKKEPCCPKK